MDCALESRLQENYCSRAIGQKVVKARRDFSLTTDVIVGFRWPYHIGPDPEPLAAKLTKLNRFADTVIARVPT